MSDMYIVTQGMYSDYKIVAVFSTVEKAQLFVSALNDAFGEAFDKLRIERYTVDAPGTQSDSGYSLYSVRIKHSGDVSRVEKQDGEFNLSVESNMARKWNNNDAVFQMFARDEAHAVKIANERRAMMIVTEQWEVNA